MNTPTAGGKTSIFVQAVWFGLAFGILEAGLLFYFCTTAPLSSEMGKWGVNAHILWIAPVFDVAGMLLLGAALWLGVALVPRLHPLPLAFAVFTLVSTYGLLLAPMRLLPWASRILAVGLTMMLFRAARPHLPAVCSRMRQTVPYLATVWLLLAIGIAGGERFREWNAVRNLPPAEPGQPNVLLIVLDTARADRMSAYGYARPTTPFLEQLAREGTLFTHALATSSWTLPSHASLFTGLYPFEHGATAERLDGSHPTLAEVFRAHGYRTAGFTANVIMTQRRTGLNRGFQRYQDLFGSPLDAAHRTTYGRRIIFRYAMRTLGNYPGRKFAEDVNRDFLQWLDGGPGASGRPFFAFLNYFDVHDPYVPPAEYAAAMTAKPDAVTQRQPFDGWGYTGWKVPAEVIANERTAYDACIRYVDSMIRKLVQALEQRGLMKNTLLVVTSDHGAALFEHGSLGHRRNLYRETIHIPLLFYFSGHVPSGLYVAQPVDLTRVPAMILALAGIRAQLPGSLPPPFGPGGSDPLLAELNQDRGVLLIGLTTAAG